MPVLPQPALEASQIKPDLSHITPAPSTTLFPFLTLPEHAGVAKVHLEVHHAHLPQILAGP